MLFLQAFENLKKKAKKAAAADKLEKQDRWWYLRSAGGPDGRKAAVNAWQQGGATDQHL